MSSSYDLDFLRFIKYVPNKYVQTIQQLKVKTLECEQLKRKVRDQDNLIQTLFLKITHLEKKVDLYKSWKCGAASAKLIGGGGGILTSENKSPRLAPGRGYDHNVNDYRISDYGTSSKYSMSKPKPAIATVRRARDGDEQEILHNGCRVQRDPQLRPMAAKVLKPGLTLSEKAHVPPTGLSLSLQSRQIANPRRPRDLSNSGRRSLPERDRPSSSSPLPLVDLSKIKQESFDEHTSFKHNSNMYQNGFAQLADIASTRPPAKLPLYHPSEMVLTGNFGEFSGLLSKNDPIVTADPTATYFASNRQNFTKTLANVDKFLKESISGSAITSYLIIVIDDNSKSDRANFFSALKTLLEKCGGHVQYLTYCSPTDTAPAIWYQQVRDILRMMPNLKMIQLKVLPSDENGSWFTRSNLMELSETCERVNFFPLFGKLIMMNFENVPYPIIEAAMNVNKGLQKLQVTRTVDMYNWSNLGCFSLQNLTDLSITCFGMDELEQLVHVNWPLKNLIISLEFSMTIPDEVADSPDFTPIFEILQKFSETLISLKVTFFERPGWYTTLSLPNLKKLEVYFMGDASLNFIVEMEALEELVVYLSKERKDSWNDTIKFNGYVSCMRKSNIWQVVKNLKRVQITSHIDGVSKTYIDDNPHLPLPPSCIAKKSSS